MNKDKLNAKSLDLQTKERGAAVSALGVPGEVPIEAIKSP